MIKRYQRPIMATLWSDDHKFHSYLKVELAASKAWMDQGLFDQKTYDALSKAHFTIEDIESFEQITKHDVLAFTQAVTKTMGDEAKYFHYGLTSTDIVDTAQSLILKEVNQVILEDIDHLMKVLMEKAMRYKMTPMMGRTHGMHAEVTSFGLKFALWFEDFKRIKDVFNKAARNVEVVKLSGAVGTFSQSSPKIQTCVADILDLDSSAIATQTLQRDRHAAYLSALALIGSELEKIAVEIRHLSRTEVREVSEHFAEGQKGSSAMPHKKNPIASENISGLARVIRGYMVSAFEDIALWHERDISHSSVERIILADSTTLIDYMLNRYAQTLNLLVVHEGQMMKNIALSQGTVHTQSILHHLIDQGYDRDQMYLLIQRCAHQAIEEERSLKSIILEDETLSKMLDQYTLDAIMKPERYLRYVDDIYHQVFG